MLRHAFDALMGYLVIVVSCIAIAIPAIFVVWVLCAMFGCSLTMGYHTHKHYDTPPPEALTAIERAFQGDVNVQETD